jgi:hypothetical protein
MAVSSSLAPGVRFWNLQSQRAVREPLMAAGYDCADTQNGDHIDDPSEDGWSPH